MVEVASASGLLALLEEEDNSLKLFSLQQLDAVIHDHWFQIASAITVIESLYEDDQFPYRDTAALLASKVFYHLGELDDALQYALGAGSSFDITDSSEYVQTILARCIDHYIELQSSAAQGEKVELDKRLVAIVERMFERCFADQQFEQAVGIALESQRLDKVEEAVQRSPNRLDILHYCLTACQQLIIHRGFREQVLRLLVRLYEESASPPWVVVCQCLTFLGDAPRLAAILDQLLKGEQDDALLAYQVGFDLYDNQLQSFLLQVEELLEAKAPGKTAVPAPAPAAAEAAAAEPAQTMDADGPAVYGPPAVPVPPAVPLTQEQKDAVRYHERFDRLKSILAGDVPIALALDFLFSHNKADLQVLKGIKASIDARNSVCHSATVWANSIMHAGTGVDTFLRENLDWLGRATNWAKFSATAGLGVIHKGNLKQSRALMAPYLPRDNGGAASSPYSEGGALYALGLIHSNHGQDILPFLLDALRASSNETIQHGACLGLGVAALGTNDEELFEEVKNILFLDNAVAGEAAGLALGLIMVGSATDKAGELLAYAHDTQHEKIIRGLAMGLALIMYGLEEGAETLIEQLTRDQDPLLRYGGMYTLGLAYRGTANNAAIQKLLHFAVSDVSDDVRRAAVMCLGFVLMGQPQQCPRIVALLAESFNPHVRYGAAMAIGLCCVATGLTEAQELLEPLLKDATDFVRQGALIAMSLVMMTQPEARLTSFRSHLEKTVADKHEEVMCRMGAAMAAGILDAGGRNCVVGLRSKSGSFRRTSVVGLFVFSQYWYWHPLAYSLSMSLQPAALIPLNKDLKVPKFSVRCNCKPSLFAYKERVQATANEQQTKVPTAVLSTTARAREKARKKDAKKAAEEGKSEAMETDKQADADGATAMDTDGAGPSTTAAVKAPEPTTFVIDCPARVVPAQEQYIEQSACSRYVPLKSLASGFVLLQDTQPDQPEELINMADAGEAGSAPPPAPAAAAPAQEPPPPEPFEYIPA